MVPGYARLRRVVVEERTAWLKEYSETCPVNFIDWQDTNIGVITSGISYIGVREVLPRASILKSRSDQPLCRKT